MVFPASSPRVDKNQRFLSANRNSMSSGDVDESLRLSSASRKALPSCDVDENLRFSFANQKSEISGDARDGTAQRTRASTATAAAVAQSAHGFVP